jgi:hypothetical protein
MRLTNEEHNIKGAVELMADDIKFIGPGMQCKNKMEYEELLNQFLSAHAGWKKHQSFEKGDEVCFIEDIYVNTPNGEQITLELAEWFKLSGGKIQRHRVFYDPTAFRSAFGMV